MLNKGICITMLTVMLPVLLQLYFLRFVSNNMPKSLFGDFSVIYVFMLAVMQVLISIPLQSFSRFYNEIEDRSVFINEYRTLALWLSVVGAMFVFILYFLYGMRFSLLTYVYSAFWVFVLTNFTIGQQAFLMGMQRGHYFFLKLSEGLAKFSIPLIFYEYFGGIESLFLGMLVGYCLSYSILLYFGRSIKFRYTFSLNRLAKYANYAYPILFSAVASLIITFSDRFFIDYYLGAEKLGFYSILCQFAGFAQVIGIAYTTYVTPILLKMFEISPMKALVKAKKYLFIFFIILCLLFTLFLMLPKELFVELVGGEIVYNNEYFLTFTIVVASVFLAVFQTALSIYFVLFKKLHVHAAAFFIVAFLNFGMNFTIIQFGVLAAAISTLIAYVVLNFYIIFWVNHQLTKT
ncbi:oligosaccharide flippase family protein [Pseudomonadales bacterium]|nr:oligosaccharide flippase family protein [Pseudomonadales bacterium]MDB9868735.1 oligosaccharide flippase family protein [Pseudomonadales bacterium]